MFEFVYSFTHVQSFITIFFVTFVLIRMFDI